MEKIKKIIKPYVSLGQAFNYDENKPETKTASVVVDAVMEAFHTLRPFSTKALSEYLGHPAAKISVALEIATGFELQEFREQWVKHELAKHPGESKEVMAKRLGFANRSALWKMFHREKRKKEYHEEKKRFEEYMKLSPEERRARDDAFHKWSEERLEELREYKKTMQKK